jgi:hypothetical protein
MGEFISGEQLPRNKGINRYSRWMGFMMVVFIYVNMEIRQIKNTTD